jgi:ribosomal protein L22
MRKAIPMRGEIPHRRGMMSGRYPVKGANEFIKLLKSLKSNALVKEIELEKYQIHAIPNNAPRPYKKFGKGRMKRSHVTIKLIKRAEGKNKTKGKKKQ